ncbi:MAG: HprK-related kinase A [Burkholderiaceae bacterium]|nr:HprK-related kinase A [Burkholderiaceae bacterium]
MNAPATPVAALNAETFAERLRTGIGLRIGPFDFRITIGLRDVAIALHSLYRDYPVIDDERVFHGHVSLREARLRRPGAPRRVRFLVDGRAPHDDRPAAHALAVLEWGLNLVVALRFHGFLMLHAAVLERDGRALVMPAMPGHGKTTLCAALAHRGWRLLSDEFGLVRPGTADFVPFPRPMPLKNESIDVLRAFAPGAFFGPRIEATAKGDIVHLRAPSDSVERAGETARAAWIVFPRWAAGATLSLESVPADQAFFSLATNAFNYELLGESAFETVRTIVGASRRLRLRYSSLDEAVRALNALEAPVDTREPVDA